jgi:DNA-binding GntR family transcriptional regulator
MPPTGVTVREMSATGTDDLSLLQAEIEGLATALGVERMPDGTIDEVRTI